MKKIYEDRVFLSSLCNIDRGPRLVGGVGTSIGVGVGICIENAASLGVVDDSRTTKPLSRENYVNQKHLLPDCRPAIVQRSANLSRNIYCVNLVKLNGDLVEVHSVEKAL
jgi:hypothetical protein